MTVSTKRTTNKLPRVWAQAQTLRVLFVSHRWKKGTGAFCAKHPEGRSGKMRLSPFSARHEYRTGVAGRDAFLAGGGQLDGPAALAPPVDSLPKPFPLFPFSSLFPFRFNRRLAVRAVRRALGLAHPMHQPRDDVHRYSNVYCSFDPN